MEDIRKGRWVLKPKTSEELCYIQDILAEVGIKTVSGCLRFSNQTNTTQYILESKFLIDEATTWYSPDNNPYTTISIKELEEMLVLDETKDFEVTASMTINYSLRLRAKTEEEAYEKAREMSINEFYENGKDFEVHYAEETT